ncbi:hypothetical protein FQR65_LT15935 [Abscondita terminalis]|nr:hypothetical protein FQR65_LT15935 [Abscondita terminalis]
MSCIVRGCTTKGIKKASCCLFRFPKDSERARHWFTACNRNDLVSKPNVNPYDSYRLCALHFEDKMYSNDLKNRLLPSAIPTIFPHLERCSIPKTSAPFIDAVEPGKKISILSDVTVNCPANDILHKQQDLDKSTGPDKYLQFQYKLKHLCHLIHRENRSCGGN